ncbi:cytochrome P450 [Calocera viscosa TUFC12733]|uniref:Cytochrome P450 n=1 Tax=Calocera viscosa (strain TUFC12733) TaxID=1330018 RepID=A0A167J6I0_CALVF|nr:cytochrome P450 [Calocera viscosa TUFC12733]
MSTSLCSMIPASPEQLRQLLATHWWSALTLLLLPLFLWLLPLRQPSGRPPVVRSWIPWIGSYWAMRTDFDAFVARARRRHGDCFGVHSLGKTMYYITSPEIISSIYKSPKEFALSPMQFEWMRNIFGLSGAAAADAAAVGQQMFPLIHKALSPAYVNGLGEAFAAAAASSLGALFEELHSRPGRTTVDLLPFVHSGVFDAATHALFGPSFPSSSLQPSFSTFDASVPALAMGLSSSLDMPFTRAREDLLRVFEQYIAGQGLGEASELIEGVVQVARSHAWSGRDTAVWLLALIWPLQANSPYAAYWLLVLMLRTPSGLRPLVEEIDAARGMWEKEHPAARFEESVVDFINEAPLPRLTSAIQETLRYATGSFSVRCVEADSVCLGKHEFRKGDHLVCTVRSLHLSEDIFEDAHKFMPTRFIDRQYKQPSYLPFGGGISQCEGRFLALAQIRTFVVLLLSTFDIALAEPQAPEVKFREGQRGFGMIRPKGDLKVVLATRNGFGI